jgi:hypothetical protein
VFISSLDHLAKYIIENRYLADQNDRFKNMIYKQTGKYKTDIVDEEGLKNVIQILDKTCEGELYSYGYWLKEIKAGRTICKLSSSHHNRFMCALMYIIRDSNGVVTLEDCSG